MRALTVGVISCSFLTGCAGYRVIPITPSEARSVHSGKSEHGYIFHAPAPYLFGKLKNTASLADGLTLEDAYDFEIVYLPDYERPFRFKQYEFLAKSELKIAFEDGWKFTGAESKTDTTGALDAIVELAKTAAGPLGAAADQDELPKNVLFRIDIRDGKPENGLELTPVHWNKAERKNLARPK